MALYTLYVQYAGRPPETKSFDKETVVIGRDVGDVALNDPQVSGRHAEIRYQQGKLFYQDLGSTNGSFLPSGERIQAPVELRVGTAVRLGQSVLTVQHVEMPAAMQAGRTMFVGAGAAPPPPSPQAAMPPVHAQAPGGPPRPGMPGYPPPAGAPPMAGYPGAPPPAPPPMASGYPPGPPMPGSAPSGYPPAPGSAPSGYPPASPSGYPGGGAPSGPSGYPPGPPGGHAPAAPGYPPPPAPGGYPGPGGGGYPPSASPGYPPAPSGPPGYPPAGGPGYPPSPAAPPGYPPSPSGPSGYPPSGPSGGGFPPGPAGSPGYGGASAPGYPPPPSAGGGPGGYAPSPSGGGAGSYGGGAGGYGQAGHGSGPDYSPGGGGGAYGGGNYPAAHGGSAPMGYEEQAERGGFMGDVRHGMRLYFSNMIPATMIMGIPLVGQAALGGVFVFLATFTGIGILATLGSLLAALFGLLGLIAAPALWYFMMRAHLGEPCGFMEAYRAVLGRGFMGIVNFFVAMVIGAIALFWPLGFFVGPIWVVEDDKRFFEINMRSLELWKPVIVRSILVTIVFFVIVVVTNIVGGILAGILGAIGTVGVALAALVVPVLSACATAVVYPLLAGAATGMYFEMRREIDGADATDEARQKLAQMASGAPELPAADGYGGGPVHGMGGYPQGGSPGHGYPPSGPGGYPPQGPPPGNYPPYGGQQ